MKKSIVFMIANMNVGGTEKSLLSILKILDKNKYDVTVLLLEKNGGYLDDIPDWITIDSIDDYDQMKPIINDPPLQNIKRSIKQGEIIKSVLLGFFYVKVKLTSNWTPFYRFALRKHKNIKKYDLAIAFAGPSNFITYFVVNKIKAVRKIQWIHFDVTQIGLKKEFGEKYYKFFDKIYCVSEGAKEKMISFFPRYNLKTEVFENVLLVEEIQKLAKIGDSFSDGYNGVKILTLGRLSQEKGQLMIPNVVRKLKEDGFDFRWYCIGEGNIREALEKSIREEGLEKYITLLGLQKNPYRFIKEASIYVQTSLQEGEGLSMKEARALNKPMVITRVASAEDIIDHDETGIIVDISEKGLYEGVKLMLVNAELGVKFTEKLALQNANKTSLYEERLNEILK